MGQGQERQQPEALPRPTSAVVVWFVLCWNAFASCRLFKHWCGVHAALTGVAEGLQWPLGRLGGKAVMIDRS
jgi:hypothetical protein